MAQEIAQAVRSGFRLSDDLRVQTEPTGLRLVGVIGCEGDIRVEIEEELRVRRSWFGGGGRPRFQLTFYRYNAVLLNRGTIFRYNSPHADHRSFHHVHRRDVLGTGEETVTRLEPADVPSIREVLKEAEDWYWTNLAGK
ncbi:MAG TPA: hypothetical protein VFE05_22390 [Longimicrobiaceae bacterium]|nr:hypothetical protein [Longimicrobiaceae bacterium]